MRIVIAKETFNRKMSLLTSKLNIELRKKLVVLSFEHCYTRDPDTNKIGAEVFGELRNMVLEKNGEDKMTRESN